MLNSAGRLCLVFVGSLVLAGCGGGDGAKRVPVFTVTGAVTLHGKPLPQAIVTFSPKEGQPVASGTTNEAGEFTLTTYAPGDGAAAGNYAVILAKTSAPAAATPSAAHSADPAVLAKAAMEAGHAQAPPQGADSLIPEAYTVATKTPLKAEVKSDGENDFTFEIKE